VVESDIAIAQRLTGTPGITGLLKVGPKKGNFLGKTWLITVKPYQVMLGAIPWEVGKLTYG